jgi:bloom syndrome protein
VIGFMVPSSLSVWIQRAGRAGRDKDPAEAILLVEPSVYQTSKNRGKNDNKRQADQPEDEEDEHSDEEDQDVDGEISTESKKTDRGKKVEPGMREWIETRPCDCRRRVSDKYFNNPKRTNCTWSRSLIFLFLLTITHYSVDRSMLRHMRLEESSRASLRAHPR